MKIRLLAVLAAVVLVVVSCDSGDVELSTGSTIITSGTNAPVSSSTTVDEGGDTSDGASTPSTLVGQAVSEFTVFARFPNDNGEQRYYVIPNGAYTDIDLKNFILELIDTDRELYGAEVFDSAEAADVFQIDEADRTDEEKDLLDRHWFLTLEGRDQIVFRGPFSDSPGGAIGS